MAHKVHSHSWYKHWPGVIHYSAIRAVSDGVEISNFVINLTFKYLKYNQGAPEQMTRVLRRRMDSSRWSEACYEFKRASYWAISGVHLSAEHVEAPI
jgi:hypothetical protein